MSTSKEVRSYSRQAHGACQRETERNDPTHQLMFSPHKGTVHSESNILKVHVNGGVVKGFLKQEEAEVCRKTF